MATYTGDSLNTLRKQDLILIALSLQSKYISDNREDNTNKDNTVLEEVCKRNKSISKLHSELFMKNYYYYYYCYYYYYYYYHSYYFILLR